MTEQYPLSVNSFATFPFRLPEQIIIGIEPGKLWIEKQSEGKNSLKNKVTKLLKATENWLSRLEKPAYKPSLENQSIK